MKRELQELRNGQRFVSASCRLKGKLIAKGAGSAVVEIDRDETRTFRTKSGEEVRIRKTKERTTWALTTIVEVKG